MSINKCRLSIACLAILATFVGACPVLAASEVSLGFERKLEQTKPVSWSGQLSSVFVGGLDAALVLDKRFGFYDKVYLRDANVSMTTGQHVQIDGEWLGWTCAYARTVFGQCVPEVQVRSIKLLP